jgi:hypothetical protein
VLEGARKTSIRLSSGSSNMTAMPPRKYAHWHISWRPAYGVTAAETIAEFLGLFGIHPGERN